jgi:NADH-quinone oxidoreductase subunit C
MGNVLDRLQAELGDGLLETGDFRGDMEATVEPGKWLAAAEFLRNDAETCMDMFTDLTAVDYPERQPGMPRFDVLLMVRSLEKNHCLRLKTRVKEDEQLDSVVSVWPGASWAEREVYDMFGIGFRNHPDLRRVLLYDEFEGHPLRKDYPITQTQPRLPYRQVEGIEKIAPFGEMEGKPWNRVDWNQRLSGGDYPVSPSLCEQQGRCAPEGEGGGQPGSASGEE